MTIFPGSIYGSMGRLGAGKQTSAAVPWWLSGGIAAANCIAAYQPKGAASLAASYVNLASPGTYNLTIPPGMTAPTWDTSYGWLGNGKCLDTGIVPDPATMSAVARFADTAEVETQLFGVITVDYQHAVMLSTRRVSDNWFYNFGAGSTAGTPQLLTGTTGICYNFFINGTKPENKAANRSGNANITESMWVLGVHKQGGNTGYRYYYGKLMCIAFYNRLLTDGEYLAIMTAMNAL